MRSATRLVGWSPAFCPVRWEAMKGSRCRQLVLGGYTWSNDESALQTSSGALRALPGLLITVYPEVDLRMTLACELPGSPRLLCLTDNEAQQKPPLCTGAANWTFEKPRTPHIQERQHLGHTQTGHSTLGRAQLDVSRTEVKDGLSFSLPP